MILRSWRMDDAAPLLDIYRQADDLSRQMPQLSTLADARKLIEERYLPAEDRAVFCIEHEETVAGCVFIDFTARDDDGAWDRGWLSYWSAPVIRGTGVMKTAVKAICNWALGEKPSTPQHSTELKLDKLASLPSPHLRRLELGYRTNNPASGKVAAAAGFIIEGIEREKFLYEGQTYDVVTAARLRNRRRAPRVMIHHVELWTANFAGTAASWKWLMDSLGAVENAHWESGVSWQGADGSYVVLEQSPDVRGNHDRVRPGMNHLAFNVESRERIDALRAEANTHGWSELFAEKYPHAGGDSHVALYLENVEGFEVELVTEGNQRF